MKPRLRESANLILSYNKNAGKSPSGLSLIAALILAAISPVRGVQAQVSPAADGTGTQVQQNGNQFDITGGSPGGANGANLFHSFEQFGLDANQTANFLATPELRNILGRVVGGNPSIINGLIQVTGGNANLFLMNPAGMVFGQDARLNVPASFFATTANGIGFGENLWFGAYGSNDYATLVGEPRAFSFAGLNGALANFGELSVNPGQAIGLSGSSVLNAGNLTAPGGEITITAVPGSNTILLGQAGHLLSLQIDSSGLANLQEPADLPSLLANNPSTHASQVTVKTDGTVTLAGSSLNNVPTTAGTAIVAGNLNVSTDISTSSQNLSTPIQNGTVGIFGEQLGIAADIDAAGTNGGGSVFIGGDRLGEGSLPTALYTFVGSDSNINADALTNGDGGSVVIWADKNTIFNGTISARGGANGGDGGFVETSGKINLGVGSEAVVDASARVASGQAGEWLLDPSDITIATGSTTATASGGNPNIFDTTGAIADVTPATIESSLNAGTSVTITTAGGSGGNGDITVKDPISKTGGGEATLTLQADRDIDIRSGANITSSSDELNVVLDATGGIDISNATITTNGGDFTATGNGLVTSYERGIEISNSSVNAGIGNISLAGTSGSSSGNNNDGVRMTGSSLETTSGQISITGIGGIGGSGTNLNDGVEIRSSSSVSSVSGAITLNGTGGGTGEENRGIIIKEGSTYIQSGGNITLTGTGSISGTQNNSGVFISSSGLRITATGAGNITLNGTGGGNGTAGKNDGVEVNTGTLETDAGTIYITGIGGSGTDRNDGVQLNNSATVRTASGSINITGTSSLGTGEENQGILVIGGSTIQSTGGGSITLSGTGSAGTSDNNGILVEGTGSSISGSGTGNVTLNGTGGNGSADDNDGVEVNSASVSSDSGLINITGTGGGVGTQNRGILIRNDGRIESTGGGNITLIGTGSAGTSDNDGILVTGTGTSISTSVSGTITLNGTGGNGSADENDGVKLDGGSLETDTGAISITGIAGSGTNNNDGVEVDSTSVSTGSGSINITGTSSLGTGQDNQGILVDGGSTIESTAGGSITLTGEGSAGTLDNHGILVTGSGSISASGAGNITLSGTGGNGTANENDGVKVGSGGSLQIDSGAISITGIAGSGTNDNDGVELNSASVRTGSGAIDIEGNITGTGGGTGQGNKGILVESGSTIESTGGGSITLTGTGSAGTSSNNGILVKGTGSIISASGAGDVTINGTAGNGSARHNDGIEVGSGAVVEVTAGELSITGLGGLGTTNNDGVELDSGTVRSLGSGAIEITGTAQATGSSNEGINIEDSSTIESSGSGNITLTGTTPADAVGITITDSSINPSATGSGKVTLTADEIDIGNSDIKGSGILQLEPLTLSADINIGGSGDTGTDILDLTADDLSNLADGFASVIIGRGSGSGSISVESPGTTLKDPVTLQSPSGSIAVNANLTGTGNASFTLNGDTTLRANISTNNHNIAINGNTTLGNTAILSTGTGSGNINLNGTVDGTADLTLDAGTGNIIVTGAIGNSTALGNLTANSSNATFNSTVDAASLTVNGLGSTQLNGNVTTTGSQIYNSAVTINGDISLTANELDFTNAVSGTGNLVLEQFDPAQDMAIGGSGATGAWDFTASEIDNLSGFASLRVGRSLGSGTATITGGTFKVPTTIESANINLNGNIATTNKNISLDGTIAVTGDTSLSTGSGAGDITLGGTVDGNNNLTLSAGSGAINFQEAVGATTRLAGLTISSANAVNSNGGFRTNDSDLSFSMPVTLTGDSTFDAGNATANFGNTLSAGSHDLTVTAAEIDFDNTVSGTGVIELRPATASGEIQLGGTDAGNTALELSNAELGQLQDGFSSLIIGRTDGNGAITVDSSGVSFSDPVTLRSPLPGGLLDNLIVNGDINLTDNSSLTLEIYRANLSADIISTGGNIDLGNAEVILGSNVQIDTGTGGGNISIGGIIDGAVGAIRESPLLTLNAGTGQVDLNGDIGQSNPLLGLSVTGGAATLPTAITIENGNNGNITVNADATLNGNSTFSAGTGTIEFGSDLSAGANNLTLTAEEINFNGGSSSVSGSGILTLQPTTPTQDINIGNTSDTAALDLNSDDVEALQNGFAEITIGRADGSGAITMETVEFSDPVRLRSPSTGGTLSLNGAVTLLDDATLIREIAGVVTVLNSITQASGDIVFSEDILLGADVSFTTGGGNIIFEGLLDGNKNLSLSATGFIDFQKAVGVFEPLSSLSMTAAEVRVAGGIATNDSNLIFNMPVNLLGDSTLNAGTGILEFNDALSAGNYQLGLVGDEINLNDAVSGTGALEIQPKTPSSDIAIAGTDNNTQALDLTATELSQIQEGFSSITIGQSDGTGTVSVNSLVVSDPVAIRSGLGSVNIDGAITGTDNASISVEAGTANLAANISTDGENITIGSQAILNADIILDTGTGGGDITFTGTLDGSQALSLNAGSGEINFEDVAGGSNPLASLSLQGSQTYIKGGISVDNSDLTFNMPVTLSEDSAINAGTATLTFNGDVDAGAFDLSLTADEIDWSAFLSGSGNLLLQAATDSLDVAVAGAGNTGALDLSNTELSQISNQFESLTIGSATGSGNISIESVTLNSPTTTRSLSGSLSVLGDISSDAELTLEAQDLNLNANISSNGSTRLEGNTSLGADVEINSNNNDIAINGTIDGTSTTLTSTTLSANGQELTLDAGSGELQLGGAVGGTNPLGGLSVTAARIEISGAVATDNADIDFSGSVTVSGSGGNFDAGTGTISFGSSLAALNQQDLTLTADEIDFNGLVSSGGSLVLQPGTPSRDIAIASTTQDSLTFDLTQDEIGYLQDGFSSITLGRADGSGQVTIDSITLSYPTTVQVPEAGGSIAVNGDTSLTDNGSLTLIAPGLNLNANIQSQGGDVTLDGNVSLGADASIESNNGAVTISGTTDGNRSLTLDSGTGQIRLEGAVGVSEPLAGLEAIASETILSGAVATDNGDISFSGDVTAISGENTSGGNFNAGTGTLSFSSSLAAQSQQDLTLTADEINLGGTVSSEGNLLLQPASPGLAIAIGSNAESSALDLTADEINNLQDGFRSVTIGRADGSGAVSIDAISLSDPTTVRVPLEPGSIAVNGDVALTDNGGLTLIAPETALAGNIISSGGAIAINSPTVSLDSDVTLGSDSGDINIQGTVDGFQQNFILDTGSGRVSFAGNLGDNAPLASLIVNARVANLQGNITTGGGEVNIQAPITLQSDVFVTTGPGSQTQTYGDVTASSTIDGPYRLIINAGNVAIGGNIGGNQPVESLEINAQGNVSLGNATTSGGNAEIAGTGDVNTGAISTVPLVSDNSTGNINVTSTDGSVNTGNLDTSGAAIALDAAGSISTENINTGGGDLTAEAAANINTGTLRTNSGAVNLTSEAGNITTENARTRGGDLTAEASGNIDTGALRTSDGEVNLNSNAGSITIEAARTGGGDLTATASGDINTGDLDSNEGNVNLTSVAGGVSVGNLDASAGGTGGNITLSAAGDITAANITSSSRRARAGDINITSSGGSIATQDITSESEGRRAGNVSLNAAENISTGDVNQTGGDINLRAARRITTRNISSRSATGRGGRVSLDAVEDIVVGDINSSGLTGAGEISIVSQEGSAIAGNIQASSESGSAASISLQAAEDVSTGEIEAIGLDVSGTINLTSTNGGTIETGEITTVATATGEIGQVTRVIEEPTQEAPEQGEQEEQEEQEAPMQAAEEETPSETTIEESSQESSSGGAPPATPGASPEEAPVQASGGSGEEEASSSVTASSSEAQEAQLETELEEQAEPEAQAGVESELEAEPEAELESLAVEVQAQDEPQEAAAVAAEQQIAAREVNLSLDTSLEPEVLEEVAEEAATEAIAENELEPTPIIEAPPALASGETTSPNNEPSLVGADSPAANRAANANTSTEGAQREEGITIPPSTFLPNPSDASLSASEVATPTTAENSSLATETALNRQEILNAVSITATNTLAMGNIAEAVPQIEQAQASEYAEYFGGESFEDAPVTTEGIRDTLGNIVEETGTKPAIVYGLVLPDQLEIVLVAPDGRPIRKVVPEAPKQLLMETVREFRGQLTNHRERNSNSYLENAQLLYKWLIAPIEKELQENNIDTILFSMDSGLRSLPIAALHDGQQFLVEKYSLGLIPSISLTNTRYRSLQNTQVLAMGASEFPDAPPLPAVPIELATITEELWQGEAFINEKFTQDNLLSQREEHGYEILHLATHGEFQAGAQNYSYIYFGDRKLGMDELRELRLRQPQVELLVLSACRTAVGDETAELGFAGLAVQSGAKSALASLWYVSDKGTLVLMSEFYRQLSQVPIKAEALRQAQIAMIRGKVKIEDGRIVSVNQGKDIELPEQLSGLSNQDFSHPYYWSAFTMIGSPW